MLSDFPLSPHKRPSHYIMAKVERELDRYFSGRSRRRTICSRYLLLDEIGSGACGTVALAADLETHVPLALKMRADTKDNRKFGSEPFRIEIEAMKHFSHAGVCKFIDSGTVDRVPFFAMEFVSGPNLHQFFLDGYRNLRLSLSFASDLCLALEHVHSFGIAHRDVKPKNVMVDMSLDRPRVVLIDFGLAKISGRVDPFLNFDETFGNPLYQPPRSELVSVYCDHRADIYSTGMLLYDSIISHGRLSKVIAAAKLATLSFSDSMLMHDVKIGLVPERLASIIRCATASNPNARFQSAKAMQDAIEDALRDM